MHSVYCEQEVRTIVLCEGNCTPPMICDNVSTWVRRMIRAMVRAYLMDVWRWNYARVDKTEIFEWID